MRTCVLTVEEQKSFDPVAFVAKLKAAGFKFVSEACPVKLAPGWDTIPGPDGQVIWRQWDPH
jgi:hypothetical protein